MRGIAVSKFVRQYLHRSAFTHLLSVGGWAIVSLAVVSSLVMLLRPEPHRMGLEMWTFARPHHAM